MNFDQWKIEVDRLFAVHYLTSWADLCGDLDPLLMGFNEGWTPDTFVEWFADKYDLIKIK